MIAPVFHTDLNGIAIRMASALMVWVLLRSTVVGAEINLKVRIVNRSSFAVRGEFIQLDQLLKAANLVSSGGEAHAAVEAGLVRVNGQPESRKRAKLRPGQWVEFGAERVDLIPPQAGD